MTEVSKNSRITFKVRDVSIDGNAVGVCDQNGMTVFCFGADVGETVSGTVIKQTSSYLVARPESRAASENCPYYPVCGGCSLLHFSYERTLEIKESHVKDCLERIGGFKGIKIDPIIPSPATAGFRNKAIYRFVRTKDGIRCGFFRRNSHDVVASDSCFCEKPLCRKVCNAVLDVLNRKGFTVYNEETAKGLLRALMVRVSVRGRAMVCLSVNSKSVPDAESIASEVMKAVPEVVSFYTHANTSKTNNVLLGEFTLIAGEKTLTDFIGDAVFEIAPESFFQVNPYATVKLYDKAFEYAIGDRQGPVNMLDVYCGIGTIGVYFAKKCDKIKTIYGVDFTEAAIAEAGRAAVVNGIAANAKFTAGDAEKVLSAEASRPFLRSADTIVVDPPRKGLGDKMPEILSSLSADRLVYVSCNPATLARDLVRFKDLGWQIEGVTPVDMFPFEGHVETVCLLSNRKPDARVKIDVDLEDYYRIKDEQKKNKASE